MDYGNKLFELRKSKLLSQEDVANELGVSRQSISLWETNQASPSMDNLISFAKLFDVSLDELVGLKESEQLENTNIDKPLFSVDYLEDKTVVYRRDYKYLNTVKDFTMFSLSSFCYFMAIGFMIRAPQLLLEHARVFMIIAFSLIIIGSLIYPLYAYNNVKRKAKGNNKIHIDFYLDYFLIRHSSLKDETFRYEVINYYIYKKDYLTVFIYKGKRIYVPNQNIGELDKFLSTKAERRNRKKPIWK